MRNVKIFKSDKAVKDKKNLKAAVMVMLAALMMFSSFAHADLVASSQGSGTEIYRNPDGSYYAYAATPVSVTPVYCFYSAYMTDYFWTSSYEEKTKLEQDYAAGIQTYQYQGISGYAEEWPTDLNMPVYRFWTEKETDHFYTTSPEEKAQLEEDFRTGRGSYRYEGIAWYVPRMSGTPVYRFYDTRDMDHYYTSSEETRQQLSADFLNGTGSYRYEGIAWYWYR